MIEKLPTFLESAGRTFGPEEEALVLEVLRSGCLTRNGGKMVRQLEAEFAHKLGVAHAVACSSGTASVHLAIAALDPEPGAEIIVPPITDIGSILPILWQNAVPVFGDVDPVTMTLDPSDVAARITPCTRAIVAVHLAGQPCAMRELRELADRHNLALIEDCSQAYWAEYDGKLAGTMGDMACFSLQQSKHITCGEGGLFVTSNSDYARRAQLFADKAWPRESKSLGSSRFLFLAQNYRMSELQGAVALGQLSKIEFSVSRRRECAERLNSLIADIPSVSAPHVPEGTKSSYWLYMLHVAYPTAREFGDLLVAEGVPAWVEYIVDPLYLSPLFKERKTYGMSGYPFTEYPSQEYRKGLCPKAERVLHEVIAILWNENFTAGHVEQIANAIRKVATMSALVPMTR
ncbi:MAG: DegT/DnrJ/EryC1/StrS family aminotransferase [Bryobacteraceae bacterium]